MSECHFCVFLSHNSCEIKHVVNMNWSEAVATYTAPIDNYNFWYDRIMRKQGLDRHALVGYDSVLVDGDQRGV